jgi:hypothetical protein
MLAGETIENLIGVLEDYADYAIRTSLRGE